MKEYKRTGWVDAITWRLSRLAMVLVAIIVAIMMFEVFMRYVLEKPTIWVNELSLWMGGWVYLLAGIYAMQQRSHIRIFLLYDIVPIWLKRVFNVLSTLFIVLWVAATIWGGSNEAWDAFIKWEKFGTAWDPPIPAITQPLILIVMLIVAIQSISNLIMDWHDVSSPEEMDDSEIEELKKAQQMHKDA